MAGWAEYDGYIYYQYKVGSLNVSEKVTGNSNDYETSDHAKYLDVDNSYAKYVIGMPSVELFTKSFDQKYDTEYSKGSMKLSGGISEDRGSNYLYIPYDRSCGECGYCGSCGFCGSCGSCGTCGYCGSCGFCGSCGSCGTCGYCGSCGFCGSCGSCGTCGYCGEVEELPEEGKMYYDENFCCFGLMGYGIHGWFDDLDSNIHLNPVICMDSAFQVELGE